MKTPMILMLSIVGAIANDVALKEFTTGNNLFTGRVYQDLAKTNDGNFLVSPFSVQTVLALTQSGAKDDTAHEIRASLRLPNTTEKTEAVYKSLLSILHGNERYSLNSANKIYAKTGYAIKDDFAKLATDVYQAGIENVDFSLKTEAAATINQWVEEQTNNKIQNLIDPKNLRDETRLILVNALYFKGNWSHPFEGYATQKRDFYKTEKDVVKVDTMYNTDSYLYYESSELKAKFLEMSYEGGDVSMVFVLPNEKEGLAELEKNIEAVFVRPPFTQERVSVSLPKFAIETKIPFTETLKNLGINLAFTEKADLSGIAGEKGSLYISDVIQKTFINVTETGTEAAAATAVSLAGSSLDLNIKKFNGDHPFIFYIQTRGIVLFGGRFSQPETMD